MSVTRRRVESVIAGALAATCVVIAIAREDPEPRRLTVRSIGIFAAPVHVAQPPGRPNLLFVVEKAGRVQVLHDGEPSPEPFLDIRDQVKSTEAEEGLLSIAFAPDYPKTGLFYVSFTDAGDNLQIHEYRRSRSSELRANPESDREVISIAQNSPQHHGGLVLFGPDRKLYIGVGDGGPSHDPLDTAQRLGTLLGKILRIDPRPSEGQPYTIPGDNPFVGKSGLDEVFAYGLRNPWRFSFDRATDTIAIADVGQDRFEEVNLLPVERAAGANFGWSAYEGFARFAGGVPKRETVKPVLVYRRDPGCAVVGGYVIRDPSLSHIFGREVVGSYLFGDYCTGHLNSFRVRSGGRGGRDRRLRGLIVPRLTSMGEDRAGHIYLASQDGPVFRLITRREE